MAIVANVVAIFFTHPQNCPVAFFKPECILDRIARYPAKGTCPHFYPPAGIALKSNIVLLFESLQVISS